MSAQELRELYARATESSNAVETTQLYQNIIMKDSPNDTESIKLKEEVIEKLTELKVKEKDSKYLAIFLKELRGLFTKLPKAKTAKIVRNIIDAIAKIPGSTETQVILFLL